MAQSYILLICLHCNINISWHPSGILVRYQDRTIKSYTIFWHSNTTETCTTVVNLKYGISAIYKKSSASLRNQLVYVSFTHCAKNVRLWSFYGSCFLSPYSVRTRENKDQKKSEHRYFSQCDRNQKSRTLKNLLDFLISKFCVYRMIPKNYERHPLTNVSVFTKYTVKLKFQNYSLFSVADANLLTIFLRYQGI